MNRASVLPLVIGLLMAACGPSPVPAATASPAAPAGSPAGDVIRPIVIDTDMGMDDLLALYMLLREPSVDVRAIAIDGTGLVRCRAGLRNLRQILGAFDRLDIPFGCGREVPGPSGRFFPGEWRDAADAMYGVDLPPVADPVAPPDAVTLLREALADSVAPVTVVALGPWTNLADLLAADPTALSEIAGIHAMAGAIDAPGNIELGATTPADQVEWNVGADPDAVAAVLALDVPVTLVPLDATNDVPVPSDIVATLDADHAAAGADIAFETYARNPGLSGDGSYWWDATAASGFIDGSLLAWEDASITIIREGRAAGRITRDATSKRAVRIATRADTERVARTILDGLRRGAARPEPFATTGTLRVTWDGTACRLEDAPPSTAGLVRVELANRSDGSAGVVGVGVTPPHTWAEVLELLAGLDLSGEDLVIPDWVVQIEGTGPNAGAGEDAAALVTLPAGQLGLLCVTGDWPNVSFVDAGSFALGE